MLAAELLLERAWKRLALFSGGLSDVLWASDLVLGFSLTLATERLQGRGGGWKDGLDLVERLLPLHHHRSLE